MSYRVILTRSAARELQSLPARVAPAIVEALYGVISENPQRAGSRLSLQLAGRWAARRGEYRIVYEIDEEIETVAVLRIGHRRDVSQVMHVRSVWGRSQPLRFSSQIAGRTSVCLAAYAA